MDYFYFLVITNKAAVKISVKFYGMRLLGHPVDICLSSKHSVRSFSTVGVPFHILTTNV